MKYQSLYKEKKNPAPGGCKKHDSNTPTDQLVLLIHALFKGKGNIHGLLDNYS